MPRKAPPHAWKPGQSGNPKGRAKNSGTIGKLREGLLEHVPAILKTLIAQAKAGDATSARLVLERCIPITKPVDIPAPIAMSGATLADKGAEIMRQVEAGEIGAAQASELMDALGVLARITETVELERRITELEKAAAEQRDE